MSEITFPALVASNYGWIELIKDDVSLSKWNYLGISNFEKKNMNIYLLDSNDKYWQVTNIIPIKPLTKWRLFLANTIYNPKVSVKYIVKELQKDGNKVFIHAIKKTIDIDDDVYKQWSTTEEINKSIEGKGKFNELVRALKNVQAI